jgi:lysophospholipase L1-like esterase
LHRRPIVRLLLAATVAASTAGVALTAIVASPGVSSAKAAEPLYLSLGDSYSVGYQNPSLGNTTGFTGYVAGHEHLRLENFGCGGATTASLFTQISCPSGAGAATDAVPYPKTTQVDAVLHYIGETAHFGKVALVTVSIGGNDVTSCASATDTIACVEAAQTAIGTNVTALVADLRTTLDANGDTTAHIVGITYPDVILGDDVAPVGATKPVLAAQSVLAFDDLINPTLSTAYRSQTGGAFVNVTSARYGLATHGDDTGTFNATTGAFVGPLTQLAGFGQVPVPVAEVCSITWYCRPATFGDIHANSVGYAFIGRLIVAKLASL